jgi:hypothetical protein
MPYNRRRGSTIAATGEFAVVAMGRNPGGSRSMRSPWLIQTTACALLPLPPRPLKSSAGRAILRWARPYSGRPRHRAAERWAMSCIP